MDINHPHFYYVALSYGAALVIYGWMTLRLSIRSHKIRRQLKVLEKTSL